MENIKTAVLGSNQYLTKFDEDIKKKKRTKIKFATKVKATVIALFLISLAFNYLLLKTYMVFKCSDGGYFISKQYCGDLYQNAQASIELDRQQRNQDLFTNNQ